MSFIDWIKSLFGGKKKTTTTTTTTKKTTSTSTTTKTTPTTSSTTTTSTSTTTPTTSTTTSTTTTPTTTTTSTTSTTTPTTSTTTSTTTKLPPAIFISNLPQILMANSNTKISVIYQGFDESQVLNTIFESSSQEPCIGNNYQLNPNTIGLQNLEVETTLIDGTKYFWTGSYVAQGFADSITKYTTVNDATLYYPLDVLWSGQFVSISTNAIVDSNSFNTGVLGFNSINDKAQINIPSSITKNITSSLTFECLAYFKQFNSNGAGNSNVFYAYTNWDNYFGIIQDTWNGLEIVNYNNILLKNPIIPLNQWNYMKLEITDSTYKVFVNNNVLVSTTGTNILSKWRNNISFSFGQENCWFKDILIKVK